MKINVSPKLHDTLARILDSNEFEFSDPALMGCVARLAAGERTTLTKLRRDIRRAVETDGLEAAAMLTEPQRERRPAWDLPELLDGMLAQVKEAQRVSAAVQLFKSARVRHVKTNPNAMSAREIAREIA